MCVCVWIRERAGQPRRRGTVGINFNIYDDVSSFFAHRPRAEGATAPGSLVHGGRFPRCFPHRTRLKMWNILLKSIPSHSRRIRAERAPIGTYKLWPSRARTSKNEKTTLGNAYARFRTVCGGGGGGCLRFFVECGRCYLRVSCGCGRARENCVLSDRFPANSVRHGLKSGTTEIDRRSIYCARATVN